MASKEVACIKPIALRQAICFYLTQATNHLKADPSAATTTMIPLKISRGVIALAQPLWLSYHLEATEFRLPQMAVWRPLGKLHLCHHLWSKPRAFSHLVASQ